jgi:hypothetical protein
MEGLAQDYRLQGNPVAEVPVVGSLVYDGLGEAVVRKFNERLKGVKGVECTQKLKSGDVISHSNTARALGFNQILREETGGDIHVLSPEEVVQYWDALPERGSTYADTDSIVIYPTEGPNESLRQKALGIVGKDFRKSKVPLIVSGLGIVKDSSEDTGFTFTETGNILVREAPYLQKDGNVQYDAKKGKLNSSEEGVRVWTPGSQNGLRRLYRNRNDGLVAWVDDLLGASEYGRVQVLQDPKGLGEKISELSADLDRKYEADATKLAERHAEAQRHLRTGQI